MTTDDVRWLDERISEAMGTVSGETALPRWAAYMRRDTALLGATFSQA